MTESQVKKITKEANRLIHEKHSMLVSAVKDYHVKYILKSLESLGYEVKKRRV